MKKVLLVCLSIIFAISILGGCGDDKQSSEPQLDTDNVFFDDFENGINKEHWQIFNSRWGDGNGGVIYENVGYTADGEVVLTSNGDYYHGELEGLGGTKGKRTGGGIKTRKTLGPGRFETRLKCLPRFGSTTAMWTFYFEDPHNHEIDIELNVENDFEYVWNTNWLKLDETAHYIKKTNVVHNDGEWHTYRFDWLTNPKRIDYYVDDVLTQSTSSYVPTFSAQFNVGNWFPVNWAGQPDFETDHTFVDWVRYTPYLDQPFDKTPDGGESPDYMYPTASMEKPIANLISNAGFENPTNIVDKTDQAWKIFGNNAVIVKSGDNHTLTVSNTDSMASQWINGTHKDFEYRLTTSAIATGSGGELIIETMPEENIGNAIETFTLDLTDLTKSDKEIVFKLTKDAKRLKISLLSHDGGTVEIDDLFMNLTKIYKK